MGPPWSARVSRKCAESNKSSLREVDHDRNLEVPVAGGGRGVCSSDRHLEVPASAIGGRDGQIEAEETPALRAVVGHRAGDRLEAHAEAPLLAHPPLLADGELRGDADVALREIHVRHVERHAERAEATAEV